MWEMWLILSKSKQSLLISEGYAVEVKVEKKKKPINPEEGD
jgi:hypothetical protein